MAAYEASQNPEAKQRGSRRKAVEKERESDQRDFLLESISAILHHLEKRWDGIRIDMELDEDGHDLNAWNRALGKSVLELFEFLRSLEGGLFKSYESSIFRKGDQWELPQGRYYGIVRYLKGEKVALVQLFPELLAPKAEVNERSRQVVHVVPGSSEYCHNLLYLKRCLEAISQEFKQPSEEGLTRTASPSGRVELMGGSVCIDGKVCDFTTDQYRMVVALIEHPDGFSFSELKAEGLTREIYNGIRKRVEGSGLSLDCFPKPQGGSYRIL